MAIEFQTVRVEGASVPATVRKLIMEELGLKNGQTISWATFGAILEMNIALLKTEIQMRDSGITPTSAAQGA